MLTNGTYLIALMAVGELAKGVIYEHSIKTGYKLFCVCTDTCVCVCMCSCVCFMLIIAGVHLAVF